VTPRGIPSSGSSADPRTTRRVESNLLFLARAFAGRSGIRQICGGVNPEIAFAAARREQIYE